MKVWENGVIKEVENTDYTPTEEEIKQQKLAEIQSLKEFLLSSDYKVIKCQEALYKGITPPYDYDKLIGDRDYARSKINELESTMDN